MNTIQCDSARYATWRKKTAGAVFLRRVLSKFNAVCGSLPADHWENYHRGYNVGALSHAENVCRSQIENSSMTKVRAKRIVENLDTTKPFLSRFEFIQCLAALSSMYSEDMDRKVTGSNQRVAHVLWCAADPDRAAWLFNNLRWRHSLGPRLRENICSFAA